METCGLWALAEARHRIFAAVRPKPREKPRPAFFPPFPPPKLDFQRDCVYSLVRKLKAGAEIAPASPSRLYH
jgi:hypothetical protein